MIYEVTYFADGMQVYRETFDILSLADAKRKAGETVQMLKTKYDIRRVCLYDGENTVEMCF